MSYNAYKTDSLTAEGLYVRSWVGSRSTSRGSTSTSREHWQRSWHPFSLASSQSCSLGHYCLAGGCAVSCRTCKAKSLPQALGHHASIQPLCADSVFVFVFFVFVFVFFATPSFLLPTTILTRHNKLIPSANATYPVKSGILSAHQLVILSLAASWKVSPSLHHRPYAHNDRNRCQLMFSSQRHA